LYGQCGDVQTFTMTADQSMADLEIDRNAYWSGAPPGEMPSETYEITFPSLEEQFPCLEGVPLLEVVINVTINDVRFRGNNCCQDFFEGIYANLYENCTGFRCGVNGDGLNDSGNPITGTCPAGGMHASYNPDNGRFDIGNFPFRSTTNCLQIQTSDRIGVDIVPSFFYGDASANGCNCSQRLVSDRLVEVSYNIEVTFVVCTRDIPALNTLPEFEPFEAICESDVPFILPTTSDDGITGTWDIPEVDPIGLGGTEVMVTFTPDPGQCAERTFNSTVEILSGEPSTFGPIDAICESADPITLPTMSNNGFTGSWDVGATFDPSGLGGTTATISFTPDNADCGSGSQLQIEVLEPEVPIFDSFAPICETATPLTLPTTSSNGISGTWDVGADFNPMGQGGSTATLTFIPENMGCAAETDVTIEVQEALMPSFDLIGPVCFNASPLTLPEQSNEGVDGSWDVGTEFDPVGLSGEQSVTFNPSMDECAVQSTQIITVGNIDVPTINGKPCSSDLTSYSVDLTTTGDRVNSSEGNVTDNGNGSFIISDIPANMEVMVTIFDDAFGCDRVIPVSAPNCNCPNVDTPTGSDVSICQGDALATLSVVVSDNSFSANWYDAPAGGNLLMMESLSFDPVTPGIYYAETLDPQNGCVSNNRIEVELVVIPLDTTFAMDMTCDPNEVGVVPEIFSTSTCDSVVLTEFVLMEMDTTYVEAMTCDPMMVGMSSVNIPTSGCDSVVITETVLVLGDTTMQTGFTCDPLLVGSFDTLVEINSFGCDSLIITQFEMSEADTFRVTGTSCDPMASFLDTMIYPTAQCDSVVITLTTILMDSEELNTMSTCDPEEAGRDTVYLTNAAGCDSLIINEFILEDGISEAVVNVEQPMCNESTGSLSISNIVGGEMPYMYSIDDGATFSENSTADFWRYTAFESYHRRRIRSFGHHLDTSRVSIM